jgi:hypothetical protein
MNVVPQATIMRAPCIAIFLAQVSPGLHAGSTPAQGGSSLGPVHARRERMRKILIAGVALLGLAAPAFASQDSGSLPPYNDKAGTFIVGSQDSGSLPPYNDKAGTFIVGSQDSGSLPDSVRGNA